MNECSEVDCAEPLTKQHDRRGSASHVAFGTVLLSTASITKLALQCILIPVLARVLGPGIIGLMSLAMLSDGGMGAALIREHDPDRELESTVYWLSALMGVALAAAVWLLAWPISILYGQPSLFYVLLALAPILIVSSSLSVANARIVRSQRFDIFAIGDVGCAIIGAVVGLLTALHGFGIWSLVGQQLAFWAAKTMWVSWFAQFRPDLSLRLRAARPLLRFSANNLATNIADFIGKNAPVLIVGGALGVGSVARYSMAYQLTRVAETAVSDPVNLAAFSAVAGARKRREASDFVLTALRILMLVLLPLFCGLALTADLLAPVVLGGKWIGTGPALAALAPGALLLCVYRFVTAVLLAKGRSGRALKLTFVTGAATAGGTFLGVHYGVTWAIVGFSIGAALLAPIYLWSLARPMQLSIPSMLSTMRTSFAATAVMSCVVLLIRLQVRELSSVEQLILAVLSGALTFTAAALLLDGGAIRRDIARLRNRPAPEKKTSEPAAWPFLPTAQDENPSLG
jgi:PST family polysaccharide transporter